MTTESKSFNTIRHKWVKDDKGKYCKNCGSRVNDIIGFPRYVETDNWGVPEYVNWYPRCFPRKN
jgi:hypothetical protein